MARGAARGGDGRDAAEACEVLRVCAVGLWLWLAEAFGAVRAAVAVSRS